MVLTANLKGVIRLEEGMQVEVHGLQNRSELNGTIGNCLQFDATKLRWGVQLPDGKKILLKMGNLLPLGAEVTPAVPSGPGGPPVPAGPAVLPVAGPRGDRELAEPACAAVPRANGEGATAPAASVAAALETKPTAVADGAQVAAAREAATPPDPRAAFGAASVKGRSAEDGDDGTPATGASARELVAATSDFLPAAAPMAVAGARQAEDVAEAETVAATPDVPPVAAPATAADERPTTVPGVAEAEAAAEALGEEVLPRPPQAVPRTGRWFQNEAASEVFAEKLCANDPTLKNLCLVPPKRFADEDVEKICAGLEVNSHCQELVASGHPLSEAGCRCLARMLRTNGSLQLLSVGDSTLGERACLLFEGLSENTSLTSLDLELKGLTAGAGKALAQALEHRQGLGAPHLEVLQLSRNGSLGDAWGVLAACPAPRELVLCDCGLGEERAKELGIWIAAGVQYLNLRDNNRLGADGLEALVEAWLRASNGPAALRRLRLDGCAVGDDGLEVLAEAMRQGLELEELFLERCEITKTGCEYLERSLRGRRMEAISVRTNLIGDTGCEILASCAEQLDLGANNLGMRALPLLGRQPVVSVELFNNPLLGQSVAAWCPALSCEHWQFLEQLDLSACALGGEGFRLICTALRDEPRLMPKLAGLCLGGNEVEDSDMFNDLVESLTEAREGRLRVIWKNT